MTKSMNRRAALGSLASVGAFLAAPTAALAINPDAALLAMQPEIDAADQKFETALSALSRAQERFHAVSRQLPGEPSAPADPEWDKILAGFADQMAEYRKRAPRPERVAHDEATKLRELAESEARLQSGLAEAERLEEEKSTVVTELKERVLAIRAKTLAGLVFKARYAAAHYEGDYDRDVMASIVDDLLEMAPEA